MKTSNKILTLLFIATFTLTGCRKQGEDGSIYLSVVYYNTVSYTDDNINVPDNPDTYSSYGPCREGNYNFIYKQNVLVNGNPSVQTVTGTYFIYANKGDKGGLFVEGEPGNDKWFELHLTNGGYILRTGHPSTQGPFEQTGETQHFERTQDVGYYTVQVKGKIETVESNDPKSSENN